MVDEHEDQGDLVAEEHEDQGGDFLVWLRLFSDLATIIRAKNPMQKMSLRRMAKLLNKSYSRVSVQLSRLEELLPRTAQGEIVELIRRPTSKGKGNCSLTDAGDNLLPLATELLRQLDAIRTGTYIPAKQTLRLGASNQFCLHLLPGAIQRFLSASGDDREPDASKSADATDVTVLEPRELVDGLSLLQLDSIDVLVESCINSPKLQFLNVEPMPLVQRHVVLMHQRFVDMLDPARRESDEIMPSDLAGLPVATAIAPIWNTMLASAKCSRLYVQTNEGVRRLAERGLAAGILMNWRPMLGIPLEANTYDDVRRYLAQRNLALRWFPIRKSDGKEFFCEEERAIFVTTARSQQSRLVDRFRKAVDDECKEVSATKLVFPREEQPKTP